MGTKIKDLIEILQQQDQEKEVEYVVCESDGLIIALRVEKQAKAIKRMIDIFPDK